jgi:hypothetical protein
MKCEYIYHVGRRRRCRSSRQEKKQRKSRSTASAQCGCDKWPVFNRAANVYVVGLRHRKGKVRTTWVRPCHRVSAQMIGEGACCHISYFMSLLHLLPDNILRMRGQTGSEQHGKHRAETAAATTRFLSLMLSMAQPAYGVNCQ